MYHGTWIYYDPRGLKVGKGIFDKGTGVLKAFRSNGTLKREVHYENNRKNGEEVWYDSEGEIERRIVYKNDRIISTEIL